MDSTPEKNRNAVVAVFGQHSAAENAIKELKNGGFDVKKLSIIGRDYHSEDHVVGFYNTGDRMKYWGKLGAFWGGLWGLLFGAAVVFIPGVGPVVAAGSFVTWLIAGLEGRSRGWRFERFGSRAIQLWHPKGQHCEVRDFSQSGKIRADCARNRGGG
jgi:hypothetical protein